MTGVALRLFFHGLIAFAPNEPINQGFNLTSAYLVKDDHHLPSLSFQMTKSSVCPAESKGGTQCKPESLPGGWCVCKLGDGTKINFTQRMVQPNQRLDPTPSGQSPTSFQTSNISWLVRMANIHNTSTVPIRVTKDNVNAKISFGWVRAHSCHLDQRPNEEYPKCPGPNCRYTLYYFDFFYNRVVSNHKQSLSEYVMFETHFPIGPVGVVLSNAAGEITLELGCGPRDCPDLLIANPTDMQPEEQDVGRHFEAYYRLAPDHLIKLIPRRLAPVSSRDRSPLHSCLNDPIRKRGQDIQFRQQRRAKATIKVDYDSSFFDEFDRYLPRAVDTRIICPMTMFDPPVMQ